MLENIRRRIKILLKARPIADPARRYFERVIVPGLGAFGVRDALFVGVGPYTWHYSKLFADEGINFITVDRRREAETWGSPQQHLTCDIRDIKNHIGTSSLDIIIIMGVIGYGVDDEDTAQGMLESVTGLLREDGHILVACESRFGVDPVRVGSRSTPALQTGAAYGFQNIVHLPGHDYSFYFMSPAARH